MENVNRGKPNTPGPMTPGLIFLYLMLTLAVILASAFGILLVMHGSGMSLLQQLTGTPPAPQTDAAAVLTDADEAGEADAEKEDAAEADAREETAGTEASRAGTDNSLPPAADADGTKEPGHAEPGGDVAPTLLSMTFADTVMRSRVSGLRVMALEGHDNPEGDIVYEATTDDMGQTMLLLPDGAYTLVWEKEGYLEDYDNLTVGNSAERGEYYRDHPTEYIFWKWIFPSMQEEGVYIAMEWKGTEDLDLCVFNAQTKEYISIIAPMDTYGNFLYKDTYSGSPGIEVVRINDASQSVVYAPYVRDGKSLKSGSYSSMEASGVRVSVYNGQRLLSRQEADPTERAGLWNPCYIYEGKVYREGSYIHDPGKYLWATFEKPAFEGDTKY